ncbi:MAG TPA: hypothetical protein PLP27_00370 [Crocinitomicaceae bacterium]|nr:hypothetical protein [Crocinitomicaceae bacterium]
MKNRFLFILLLAGLIGGFFMSRFYLFHEKPFPKIEDRLPDAPMLGRINVVDFVDELKPLLFKNKVKYRDFIASDFILSQTKTSGIDLQKPVYFYQTENEEWGALISVSDSSKVPKAVTRLKSLFDIQDTIVNGNIIYKFNEFNTYFCYERNWFFVYRGNHFIKHYLQVKYADHTSRKQCWKDFLENDHLKNDRITLYFRPKELVKERLHYASASISVDSNSLYVKTIVADKEYFPIQLKKGGLNLTANTENAKHYVNLHLDTDSLKVLKHHFIYTFLNKYARKISFPLNDFIQGWNGDLSASVGGKMKVKETFVETEFDADFNSVEVTKSQWVDREVFSCFMTTTPDYQTFVNKLFAKGYLRKNNDDYFFLMSPPVKLFTNSEVFYIYTGRLPKVDTMQIKSSGKVLFDNATFSFGIDSTSKAEMFLNVVVPFDYLGRKYALTK